MNLIKKQGCGLYLKDLFKWRFIEKQGFVFYYTRGGDLYAIPSKDTSKKLTKNIYKVKLTLFERVFNWTNKKLDIKIIKEIEK